MRDKNENLTYLKNNDIFSSMFRKTEKQSKNVKRGENLYNGSVDSHHYYFLPY